MEEVEHKIDARPRTLPSARPSSLILHPLTFILIMYFALATLYNAVVPLGEGPDETGHMNYVLFLANEGRLPVQGVEGRDDVPGEGHQPPLAYLLAAPATLLVSAEQRQVALTANPSFVWSGGEQPNAFVRGSQELWPWRAGVLAWHLARSVSALWGALVVGCTWAIARRLHDSPTLALLAAALVAFNPQFLFTSALVTNDALLAALSAGSLLAAMGKMQHATCNMQHAGKAIGEKQWAIASRDASIMHHASYIILGLLLGLALITKQSALILLPLLPLAAWLCYGRDWRRGLGFLVANSVVIALVAGWWYLRNWRLYGDLFGLEAFRAEFLTQAWDWRDPAAWLGALWQLHESFWGRFGWMSVYAPNWWSVLTAVLVLIATVGVAWRLVVAKSEDRRALLVCYGLLVVLPALALVWTLSFALTAGLVAWQGRFLFPAIAPIAVLLAAGMGAKGNGRWAMGDGQKPGPPRMSLLVTSIASLVSFAAAIYLPLATIAPSYSWHVISQTKALQQRGEPVYLRFAENWKQGVELRGWRQEGTWRAGETVSITFTWHALEPSSRNWAMFIHLIDSSKQIVAERNMQPLGGQAPMKLWTANDWLQDPQTLILPENLAPGEYTLRIGLYDQQSKKGRRQGIWDESGEFVGDGADLARITVMK